MAYWIFVPQPRMESAPLRTLRSGTMAVVPKYLQLRKKLEEFSDRLDICSEGTPQVTDFFEVFVREGVVPARRNLRKPEGSNENPLEPKVNK
uniref:Uncharacterized protein n=1 Tax=Bos indicus x Bos taurus TaxID=30522 RepID=A0A4W2FHC7_BOBOX